MNGVTDLSGRFLPGALLGIALISIPVPSFAQDVKFRRGDSDLNGNFEISDAVLTLQVMFLHEPRPGCDDAMDVNDDGRLNVVDPIYSLRVLYLGGDGQFPLDTGCGLDTTEDALGCLLCPPCAEDPVTCLDQDSLNEILGSSIQTAFSFCIPAGLLNLPSGQLSISICPEEGAQPCGSLETPGCPIQITSITASLHAEERSLVVHVEGRMEGLPVKVSESVFNTSTTCQVDFHGAEAALPFGFDVVFPLVLAEEEPGVYSITGVETATIGNVVMEMTASGTLLCRLLSAAQDVLVQGFVAFMEGALGGLMSGFQANLVGLKVCAAAGN